MNYDILKKIIENYDTPVYVFDIPKLKKRVEYIKSRLPKKVKLCFAIKANPFIIKEMEDFVERFEVCSPGEYEICKHKKINVEKILISGVYKTSAMINEMVSDGISNFTVESMEQFNLLKNVKITKKLKLLLRITSGNQFGINIEDAREIINNRNQYENIEIVGLQYFSGTQKKSIKNLNRELTYMQNFIDNLNENYNYEAKEFEFGPGFPIDYFENDKFNEETFFEEFSNLIEQMTFKGDLILEIGRSMVASCGSYITKIVDKKINKDQKYAILDGGIHHLVYYGQFMAMKVPICEVYPQRENTGEKWNLCGSLCTINDVLVKQFPCRKFANW